MCSKITNERRADLDHDLFGFRTLGDPEPSFLPHGARVAFSLIVVLQRFHVDRRPPFAVPGMLDRPSPDIGNASQREVGLREGFWRIAEEVDQLRVPTTFVVEADALELLQDGLETLRNPIHCIAAGGRCAASLHTEAMPEPEEVKIIAETRAVLESGIGRKVKGWRSPAQSQSLRTTKLLAQAGYSYCGDFNNDDRPYLLFGQPSPIVSIPMHHFTSDLHAVFTSRQPVESYLQSHRRGIAWLLAQESTPPVILPMVVHPWIMGTPQRFRLLRSFLSDVARLDQLATMNAETLCGAYVASDGTA
jgi:allantoinase